MANASKGSGPDRDGTVVSRDKAIEDRLKDLDARLETVRSREKSGAAARRDGTALGLGLRIASELVAAILVGGVIGWQLDKWLGTTPVLLILLFLLGAAAGLRSVMRRANSLSTTGDERAGPRSDPPSDSA